MTGVRNLAGSALGSLAGSLFRIRRSIVEEQLGASFPEKHRAWVRTTARACYRHFGRELAVIAGGRSHLERAVARTAGVEKLTDGISPRKGAVLVSGHIGNWELGGAALRASGLHLLTVAQWQKGFAGRRLQALRRQTGLEVIERGPSTARQLRSALAKGGIVALIADQHSGRGSVRFDFLGRPAWTSLGPARLSVHAGVPLYFVALLRDEDGHRFVFEEVGSGAGDVLALTRRWVGALEREVRAHPAQYFWFHRRWKDRS